MVSKAAGRSSRVSAVTLPLCEGLCHCVLLKEQFRLSEIVYTQTVTHLINQYADVRPETICYNLFKYLFK